MATKKKNVKKAKPTPGEFTIGEVILNLKHAKAAASLLRAFNHPLRQKLLKQIDSEPGICVTDLYNKNKIEQSVCSQHLAILRRANLVTTQRDGKLIHYTVNGVGIKNTERVIALSIGQLEIDF